MASITTNVDVDVDVDFDDIRDEVEDNELIEELEDRGYSVCKKNRRRL